jgi:hypothetical protein
MALRKTADAPKAPPRAEVRHNDRREASQLPIATALRFSPQGTSATLVNISPTGLLAECPVRLSVGSSVTVQFEGDVPISSVVSRVARCAVSTIGADGVLRYHVGLAFNTPITLDDPPAAAAGEENETTDAAAPPVVEHDPPARRNRW